MSKQRTNIIFTGGSGKAGKHMLPWLAAKGYNVLNVDKVPLRGVEHVHNIVADITNPGEMHNVMETYGKFGELDTGDQSFAAVVHFAAIPALLVTPDSTLFHINTVGTYNVIEAALARASARSSSRAARRPTASASPRGTATTNTCRWTRTIPSIPWTATPCRRCSTSIPPRRFTCARAPTSTRCASAT